VVQNSSLSMEERLKWYERILQLSRRAQDESLDSVCRYLMDDAIAAAKAEAGYFFLFSQGAKPRVIYARTGSREDIPKNEQFYSESIVKRAIEMQAPLILDDASAHPEFRQAVSVVTGHLKSVLAMPFFYEKKPIALIYLENRSQTQYFAPNLLEFLTLFSSHAAILLHSKLSAEPQIQRGLDGPVKSNNPQMQKILQHVELAAKSDTPVLILGETGTGKEVLAGQIHQTSVRRSGNFVPINCAAIPETLIESELFGYKKGAFTGANADREGLIRRANKGTVFLDEIGDLQLHMQVKLLRVIQEKRFTRLGATQEEESDFRLICATHQPLDARIEKGFFRQDLYFRINTITINLPPLRQRPEDLLDLANQFLSEACQETRKSIQGFDQSASTLLLNQEWPGNIRQLKNAVQRAVALVEPESHSYMIQAKDFDFLASKGPSDTLPKLADAKDEFIRNYVKKAILIHKGNKTKAAKALGVDPKTLYRHLLEDDTE
jgi:DNA-binding NtrC family response regulator